MIDKNIFRKIYPYIGIIISALIVAGISPFLAMKNCSDTIKFIGSCFAMIMILIQITLSREVIEFSYHSVIFICTIIIVSGHWR